MSVVYRAGEVYERGGDRIEVLRDVRSYDRISGDDFLLNGARPTRGDPVPYWFCDPKKAKGYLVRGAMSDQGSDALSVPNEPHRGQGAFDELAVIRNRINNSIDLTLMNGGRHDALIRKILIEARDDVVRLWSKISVLATTPNVIWNHIYNVPKDGRWILLKGGKTNEDNYAGELDESDLTRPVVASWSGRHWVMCYWDGHWLTVYENPTHWAEISDEDG